MTIVVTAATGQFGRLVVENLLERGVPAAGIAAVVRTPSKAADLAARGVEIREGDYENPETLVKAFAGADKLLFVSSSGPHEDRIRQHRNVVAAAKEAGVGQIQYTSITDADTNPLNLAEVHKITEEAIAEAGIPAVLLRNGWYFENRTGGLAGAVEAGAIPGSARDGRIAFASRADLAEAAAVTLSSEGHVGKVYELTGDAAWSVADLAAETALQSGKEVVYADLPAEKHAELLAGFGLPGFLVELIVDADANFAEGALAKPTGDLSGLLGRPTTTLAEAVSAALKG